MTNMTSASLSTSSFDVDTANPFTSSDPDDLPPLPELPPDDPAQLIDLPSPEKMPVSIQISQENERLKAELFAIHVQRAAEQQAYSNFIKAIEALNTLLPESAKTVPMRTALRSLVDISGRYRDIATEINDRRQQAKDTLKTTQSKQKEQQQPLTSQLSISKPAASQLQTAGSLIHNSSFASAQTNPQIEKQNMVASLKEALAHLQISRPTTSSSLDESLMHLKHNVDSFASFVVLYLNGRHGHFTSTLRSEVHGAIDGFFADEDDARQVVRRVMKIIRNGVKYVENDVQRLSGDIVGPMGLVLWTLVSCLERNPS